MPDDLRQRYAEALAAKFTYPVYRCDKDGENEWVENPEPADRVEQTPYVMFTAGDGNRSFWTPTCTELSEVVAAVRDEEMTALRERAEKAEEALYSSQLTLDRVVALARTLADTNPAMADLIAETIVNMPGECAPGAALALLDPPEPR